jgi:hypothetical protein
VKRTLSGYSAAVSLAALALVTLFGGGCGGASSGINAIPVASRGTGSVAFKVIWPQKTRLIPALTGSIQAVLSSGSTTIASKLLTPPSTGNVSTVTFQNVNAGTLSLTATAYPNADGSGVALASGASSVDVVGEQTASVTVTMQSTIDHLELSPTAPAVTVGKSLALAPTAKDAHGNVVLLSSGKLTWQSANTGFFTVNSGVVTGVAAGSANVTVTDTESGKSVAVSCTVNPPIVSNPFLYDGFSYSSGSAVAGLNGGSGTWGSAWNEYGQGETASMISTSGLTYPGLATSGNAIQTTSDYPVGHARRFSVSPGKSGSVLFISFLMKPLDAMNVGYPSTYFGLAYGGVGIDKPGDSAYYALENDGGGGEVKTNVLAVTGQTVFMVVRITFGPTNGNDTVDLFVNPTPGQPLPATPNATKTDRNTGLPADFNFGGSIRCLFDEIRFGHTFDDVAPPQ